MSEDGEIDSYCLSDAGLAAVGEGFTKLEKLSLIWCSNVTNAGVKSLVAKCSSLRSLDLQVNVWLSNSFFLMYYHTIGFVQLVSLTIIIKFEHYHCNSLVSFVHALVLNLFRAGFRICFIVFLLCFIERSKLFTNCLAFNSP